MADRQRAGITGNATMRVPITGDVNVGGRSVRELRFMPRSAFPEVGRSDVLYIDTLGECIYYWDGGEYVQLSGGGSGTDNYNSLQNRPKINNVTLEGEQTSSDLGLQSSIDDLSSIRSGATAGSTSLQPEDVDTLPTDGSSNPVSSGGTYDFVNSSIATNTAYFIGTFASVAELEAYSGTVTNNDYAFVTSTDSAGNTLYNRYKYNAATQIWSFEYAVNNTAFTTAQWAAIQSGLTASDKTKLDGIEQGANKTVIDASPTSGSDNAVSSGGVHTALSGKQDTIADLSDIRSGASAGATAVQPSALNDYQTKLSGTNKLDPSYIDYDTSHRAVSDAEKSTWNGKQDTISDLSTIRSGAAAGATALQPSDVTSTYSASGTAPVNGTAVNAAIETLDVSSVGGSGKYISAISETDGKIAATAETMDTTPTQNSTKALTSGAVYTALASKQDALSQSQLAAANSGITAAKLTADEAALVELVDGGAKNVANWSASTSTISNVVFTISGGVVTVTLSSGTKATARSRKALYLHFPDELESGAYVLSGSPTLGAGGLYMWDDTAGGRVTPTSDMGSGTAFTFNYDKTHSYIIEVDIAINQAIDNNNPLVFKPMICTAADWAVSQKYVPYCPSLPEVYAEEKTKITMQQAYSDCILIATNADLNSYTTAGIYYATIAVVPTLTNTPYTSTGFRLVIEKNSLSGAAIFQTITPTSTGNISKMFKRVYENNAWSSWYKFEGTAVI